MEVRNMNNLTKTEVKTKTKRKFTREAKFLLLKAFVYPQLPFFAFFCFLNSNARAGYEMDCSRHSTPVLGEWNHLETILSEATLCVILGLIAVLLTLARVALNFKAYSTEVEVLQDSENETENHDC
jgi:hypothetical protein